MSNKENIPWQIIGDESETEPDSDSQLMDATQGWKTQYIVIIKQIVKVRYLGLFVLLVFGNLKRDYQIKVQLVGDAASAYMLCPLSRLRGCPQFSGDNVNYSSQQHEQRKSRLSTKVKVMDKEKGDLVSSTVETVEVKTTTTKISTKVDIKTESTM
ncbi:hypothetical protein Clacol_010465 [Clathrus columnatus]|uniref:Uncharacterized protein n=1 Tax=Clathrus columnatus TaxID=1419009 RepID=A0AAV5ANX0_9AGAM|nr:hypothetical protein Clacol_010465 [Clathrus columnatus]